MKKFTLIELLVVVAIIGILASLLLPSLQKARRVAKIAVCKSQLHQFSIAGIAYADDNNSKLPDAQASSHPGHGCYSVKHNTSWYGHGIYFKLNYMNSGKIYHCPGGSKKSHRYGKGNAYGGFREDISELPTITVSSYNYRSSFESPWRAADLIIDPGSKAIMSDHFVKQYAQYCHLEGYSVLYLDGSISFNRDKSVLAMDISNTDYSTQETVWQIFDK